MFDSNQRQLLLKLAREAIATYMDTRMIISAPPEEFLTLSLAAFVTLKIDRDLRGCIGSTEPTGPLGNTVIHCAISSAFRDPRFPPLSKEEYGFIKLEISVLSPFQKSRPEEIIAGTHGVMITKQDRRALLLPQVATEWSWDSITFLRNVCRKAGLPSDAWKDPSAIIESFTAEIFGE